MNQLPPMKPIPSAPGYFVTECGRVFSKLARANCQPPKVPRELSPFECHRYRAVHLQINGRRRKRYVHSIVLSTYVGPRPKGMQCRHLDGTRDNNHVSNLAWGTRSENQMDRVRHETHHRGERHGMNKYSRETVLTLRRMAKEEGLRATSEELDIPYSTVCVIARGDAWGWLDAQTS